MSSVQLWGIRIFCPPWDIFGLSGITTFWLKKSERKSVTIHKNSCIIFCVKMF